jgi:hypothetical protein
MNPLSITKNVFGIAVVAASFLVVVANAQPYGAGRGGWGSGMMGPGMMGGFGYGRMCGPNAAGFAEWRVSRLESLIKPTESQRESFDAFKKASVSAGEILREGCSMDFAATAPRRVEAMEKRMDAMLRAAKIVRPAFETFYATLNPEQKAILDNPNRRRGPWWH